MVQCLMGLELRGLEDRQAGRWGWEAGPSLGQVEPLCARLWDGAFSGVPGSPSASRCFQTAFLGPLKISVQWASGRAWISLPPVVVQSPNLRIGLWAVEGQRGACAVSGLRVSFLVWLGPWEIDSRLQQAQEAGSGRH